MFASEFINRIWRERVELKFNLLKEKKKVQNYIFLKNRRDLLALYFGNLLEKFIIGTPSGSLGNLKIYERSLRNAAATV